MKKQDKFLSAIALIVLGLLFIFLKQNVIGIAMSILAVVLVVLGILDLIASFVISGTIKIALAIIIGVLGWTLAQVVLYVIGALFLFYGIYNIYLLAKSKVSICKWIGLSLYLTPIFQTILGILLLFYQGGTVSWFMIVLGIFFILDGVWVLIQCLKNNNTHGKV